MRLFLRKQEAASAGFLINNMMQNCGSMEYDVKQFGAAGDGIQKDTKAIQAAIDRCSRDGGGRVVLAGGCFLTGTLYMKGQVELYIAGDAVLKASPDIADYTADTFRQLYRNEAHMDKCLIFSKDVEHIAFSGEGCVDGNGVCFVSKSREKRCERPMLFRFLDCKEIHIRDLKLLNPASWTTDFVQCEKIWVERVNISSLVNGNGDGLDFNACQDVIVSDCRMECSDDCICLQNSEEDKKCKNVVITNCILYSKWAGIRIGLLSCGDIENVTVSNCIFSHIQCSAIKIQSAEGAAIRRLVFENLVMEEVQRPLLVTQNYRRERVDRPEKITGKGIVEGLSLENVMYTEREEGDPGCACAVLDAQDKGGIRNVRIRNLSMYTKGGCKRKDNPEQILNHKGKRAECHNYQGQLPACGLFARNVENAKIEDLQVFPKQEDEREKIVVMEENLC